MRPRTGVVRRRRWLISHLAQVRHTAYYCLDPRRAMSKWLRNSCTRPSCHMGTRTTEAENERHGPPILGQCERASLFQEHRKPVPHNVNGMKFQTVAWYSVEGVEACTISSWVSNNYMILFKVLPVSVIDHNTLLCPSSNLVNNHNYLNRASRKHMNTRNHPHRASSRQVIIILVHNAHINP